MRDVAASTEAIALAALAPLDRARRALLAPVARVSRPLIVDREARVAVTGALSVAFAFALTAAAPLWLLLLGPIVLGVPHILADVRYLVVRPGLHRRWPLWLACGAPLAWAALGGGVRAGMLATLGALVVARGRPWLRAALALFAIALGAVAWRYPWPVDLAFAHLHNFVGVALWWAWRARAGRLHRLPLAAFALGTAVLALGAFAPRLDALPYEVGGVLVPDALFAFGGRLVAIYAFAQSVHYAVWIRMIPDEDRPQPTPRPFAATFRALVADVGPWVCGAAALTTLALVGYALVDVVAARGAYLQLAIAHGHLELCAGALLLAERRLPLRGR